MNEKEIQARLEIYCCRLVLTWELAYNVLIMDIVRGNNREGGGSFLL